VIDPNPSLKRRFKSFRPRDRFVLAGVGEASEKTYFEFNDASYNTFSKEEADKYLAKIGDKNIRLISKSLRPIKTLAEILQGVDSIDYLNIDVQGMDLEVLQSYDWNCYPKVISIEDENFTLENPGQIYSYLCGKGYALMGVSQLTLIFKKI
jgi:peptidoglycan/xylan/chitin deacetylase (PgdA/CDA1 family)